MSIREVLQSATKDASRTQRMVRVIVTDDLDLYAVWRVVLADGSRTERSVQVSGALKNNIVERTTFNAFLDQIRDDTVGRIGA